MACVHLHHRRSVTMAYRLSRNGVRDADALWCRLMVPKNSLADGSGRQGVQHVGCLQQRWLPGERVGRGSSRRASRHGPSRWGRAAYGR